MDELLAVEEYRAINALPRVSPRKPAEWESTRSLVDLEQARTATSMLPTKGASRLEALETDTAYVAWKYPDAALTGVLPQQQPFRSDDSRTTTLVFLPDEDEEELVLHRIEEDGARRNHKLYPPVDSSLRHNLLLKSGKRIGPWGEFDLMALLIEQAERLNLPLRICAERMAIVQVPATDQGWRYHPWLGFGKKK